MGVDRCIEEDYSTISSRTGSVWMMYKDEDTIDRRDETPTRHESLLTEPNNAKRANTQEQVALSSQRVSPP